jgi:hypothetical protein
VTQPSLFCESLADALREVVRACGGSKPIGARLWPEKAPETAGRLLQDCLNDARPEKLSPEQVLLIARMGRERQCHAVMQYLARESGYADPQPIEPEDERAILQRQFIESTRLQAQLVDRLERLHPTLTQVRRA